MPALVRILAKSPIGTSEITIFSIYFKNYSLKRVTQIDSCIRIIVKIEKCNRREIMLTISLMALMTFLMVLRNFLQLLVQTLFCLTSNRLFHIFSLVC